MGKDKLLSAKELAQILGLSVETIWRYTREEKIPYLEIGKRQYRYRENEVLRSLQQKDSKVTEESRLYLAKKKLTYQDYAELATEPGTKIELIDGMIIREPSPTTEHQRVSIRLQVILLNYFAEKGPGGEVLSAPLDLYIDEHTIVQPDLLYFCGANPAGETPIKNMPQLVVEIISPSSARKDRVSKLNLYQEAKIPHYWLVDPDAEIIECYRLETERYLAQVRYDAGTFTHPSFPNLCFELKDLFRKPS